MPICSLSVRVATARTPERGNALRAKRDDAPRLRGFLAQQRGTSLRRGWSMRR